MSKESQEGRNEDRKALVVQLWGIFSNISEALRSRKINISDFYTKRKQIDKYAQDWILLWWIDGLDGWLQGVYFVKKSNVCTNN